MAIQFVNGSVAFIPKTTNTINVWVWGDNNTNSVTASIINGFAYEGYSVNVSSSILTSTWTGDMITGSNAPDVLIYWTNGGGVTGASTLPANLRKYINTGKGLVTSVFIPSIRPTNWDGKLSPIQGTGTQGNSNLGTGSLVSSSIILQGVDLALNNASSRTYFYETITAPITQSGAVVTANWNSINQPLLVEQISGSNEARLAYLNFLLQTSTANNVTGSRKLLTRTLLWAAKQI